MKYSNQNNLMLRTSWNPAYGEMYSIQH